MSAPSFNSAIEAIQYYEQHYGYTCFSQQQLNELEEVVLKKISGRALKVSKEEYESPVNNPYIHIVWCQFSRDLISDVDFDLAPTIEIRMRISVPNESSVRKDLLHIDTQGTSPGRKGSIVELVNKALHQAGYPDLDNKKPEKSVEKKEEKKSDANSG